MKKLLSSNSIFRDLKLYLEKNIKFLEPELVKSQEKATSTLPKKAFSSKEKSDRENKAVTIIQKMWRKRKVKQAIAQNPYFSYLSLISPDDEQRLLSTIMFGRHQAEFRPASKERIHNPYIHDNAVYHRDENVQGILFDHLIKSFSIDTSDLNNYHFIPFTILKNSPIDEILNKYFPSINRKIITAPDHSIGLLAIPKRSQALSRIKSIFSYLGLAPSPWEVAINVRNINSVEREEGTPVILDSSLPKTKSSLLQSEIFIKLNFIAKSSKFGTQKLAVCLKKMIEELPDLSPQAIQRIALMLDLANTFYAHNYPRFAFSVYAIIHEISLGLLVEDRINLEKSFQEFVAESKQTFYKSFGLQEENLSNSTFFASPTMSGTNAHFIATKLASKMWVQSGTVPKVKVLKPSYFEFDEIVQSTSRTSDADIVMMSAGPIVNPEGLTPGVDINRFVKRNFIQTKRKKPMTIIIDATTTLYKNLKLDDEVKQLVDEGKLSIIVHESHQKFGLLHSDQAQYGRVFGVCAKNSYSETLIQEIQGNAQQDFNEHLDLRIGAFISCKCGETLEEIKEQHFTNGALLRNILVQSSLVRGKLVKHEDMLTNLNELYFVASTGDKFPQAVKSLTEFRASFGHYNTVYAGYCGQTRISPDASDDVDCLIQTSQIYLALHYTPNQLLGMLIEQAHENRPLSLDEQIVSIAILNNVITNFPKLALDEPKSCKLSGAIANLLKQCSSLEGRKYHSNVVNFYNDLKETIAKIYQPENKHDFFSAIQILYQNQIPLDAFILNTLSKNKKLSLALIKLQSLVITKKLITTLSEQPQILDQLLLNISKKPEVIPLLRAVQDKGISLKANDLVDILSKPEVQPVILAITSSNFKLTPRLLRKIIESESLRDFILNEHSLNEEKISTALALTEVFGDFSEFIPLLSNSNFCHGILKIDDLNQRLLIHLKRSPEKFTAAKTHSPEYLMGCYSALKDYCVVKEPTREHLATLIKSLENSKEIYSKTVLSKDRTPLSKAARILLAAVVNFFALFTFGRGHYANYKSTGNALFFATTKSEGLVNETHKELYKDFSVSEDKKIR